MSQSPLYRFSEFELNAGERTLHRSGERIEMTPKCMDLLFVFVRSEGCLLTVEELNRTLWPNVQVGQNNLAQQISALRKALRNAEKIDFIETIPKTGYRFQPAVLIVDAEHETPPTPAPVPTDALFVPAGIANTGISKPPSAVRHPLFRSIAVAVATLLAVSAVFVWFHFYRGTPVKKQLAVVGFRNVSGREDLGWISTALEEVFRTYLSGSDGLRTVSGEDMARVRTELHLAEANTFSRDTLARVRNSLECGLVLSGSYFEFDRDGYPQLRLDLAVQDTQSGVRLVSLSESGPVAGFPDLAAHASRRLLDELGMKPVAAKPSDNLVLPSTPEARRAYAEGLARWRAFDPLSARDRLLEAVRLDPASPLAHSLLAECWWTLGYHDKAAAEARIASEMGGDTSMASALIVQGRYREISGEYASAVQIYRSLWRSFPDDSDYGLRVARAQTSAGKGKEALETIKTIQDHGKVADPRLALAEAAAWQSLGEFKPELSAAKMAAQWSGKRGALLLQARALQLQGWALDNLGRRQEAEAVDVEAQRLFAQLGDRDGEARALKNLADVLDDDGRHAEAAKAYEGARTAFASMGNSHAVALCLNNMAYAFKDLGDFQGAEDRFRQSLEISRGLDDRVGEARALNGVAMISWRREKLTEAERLYRQAIDAWEKIGDRANSATVTSNLAIVLQQKGRYPEALELLRTAEKVDADLGDPSAVARVRGNIGDLFLAEGNLDAAEKEYTAQLVSGQSIPELKQQAYAHFGLGEVMHARGRLTDSMAHHRQALDIRTKSDEKELIAESELAIAQVEFDQKNWIDAEKYATSAAAQFHAQSERTSEARALVLTGRIALATGRLDVAARIARELSTQIANPSDRDLRAEAGLFKSALHSVVSRR